MDGAAAMGGRICQILAVANAVFIGYEAGPAVAAALDHVLRNRWQVEAGKPCHAQVLWTEAVRWHFCNSAEVGCESQSV